MIFQFNLQLFINYKNELLVFRFCSCVRVVVQRNQQANYRTKAMYIYMIIILFAIYLLCLKLSSKTLFFAFRLLVQHRNLSHTTVNKLFGECVLEIQSRDRIPPLSASSQRNRSHVLSHFHDQSVTISTPITTNLFLTQYEINFYLFLNFSRDDELLY